MSLEDLELGRPDAPHRTMINITTETHELLPSGECRGIVIQKQKKLLFLDGENRFIALNRINELLQEITNKCQS
jgi:hypothetical protein